jgi:hypothetical protein
MNPKENKDLVRRKETLFRVSYRHQSKLIQIADYKAGIIISINAMIISSVIAIIGYGVITNKLGDYGMQLIIPISLIVIFCLISLVLAIEVARPKLILKQELNDSTQKSSLLFFGVIADFTQQDYIEKLNHLLSSGDDMYEHMTIDLYYQGVILKRKFNLLVYAYHALMFGFVFSALIFLGFLVFSN